MREEKPEQASAKAGEEPEQGEKAQVKTPKVA